MPASSELVAGPSRAARTGGATLLLRCEDTPETFAARNRMPLLEEGDHLACWIGAPLLPDHREAQDAMRAFLARLRTVPLSEVTDLLEGIFAVFVFAKHERRWYVFGDQGGCLRLFHDRRRVSTSFLALLADGGYTPGSLNPQNLATFLLQGAIFGEHATVVRDVRILPPDRLALLDETGVRFAARRRSEWRGAGPDLVEAYLARHAAYLAHHHPSVDLTGGSDSRVLFAIARRHLQRIEAAVVGPSSSADVRIARDLARLADVPLHVHEHRIDRLETELWPTFLDGDGQIDIAAFHLNWQNLRARRARGVGVIVHGGGGELFRDGIFAQDFPFYNMMRPRLERYYDWQVCPIVSGTEWFSSVGWIEEARKTTLAAMRPLATEENCTTYDTIFYTLKVPWLFGSFLSAYVRMGVDVLAPFLEWRNASWAIHQPPFRRAFHQWHREALHDPVLAALPTAEGYPLLPGSSGLLRALPGYLGSGLRRLARKAGERLWKRTWFIQGATTLATAPDFAEALRASRECTEALEALVRIGFARPGTTPRLLRDGQLGKALAMGMLVRFLEGRR